ncbi:hypothetical protein CPSG_07532 [Coccidioides posadasii str. Silveira]|uniref:Uncharacterized protein n=1 Tax=Coccidioides posadasii (strain RMSCC 757 / Silveira) TaxID=443226 RepID=E9DCI0_COCPS|nr:hypothetical protein CPSG_07532 [Coccidioides posadasii str. Silveira]
MKTRTYDRCPNSFEDVDRPGVYPPSVLSSREHQSFSNASSSYHINRCTFPGSCGHSNPLYKNMYPVTAFTIKNHTPSIIRGKYRMSCLLASLEDALMLSLRLSCSEYIDEGICNRHKTQGMIKYRGSTRGAVIRQRVVDASHTITKLTRTPSVGSSRLECREFGESAVPSVNAGPTALLYFIGAGPGWCSAAVEVPAPKAEMEAQPQRKYTGVTAYLMNGFRSSIRKT